MLFEKTHNLGNCKLAFIKCLKQIDKNNSYLLYKMGVVVYEFKEGWVGVSIILYQYKLSLLNNFN